jgi:hypothetical protein
MKKLDWPLVFMRHDLDAARDLVLSHRVVIEARGYAAWFTRFDSGRQYRFDESSPTLDPPRSHGCLRPALIRAEMHEYVAQLAAGQDCHNQGAAKAVL